MLFYNIKGTQIKDAHKREWVVGEPVGKGGFGMIYLCDRLGSSNDIDNYRPISVTNAMYKFFTAILQKRIANEIDPKLQKTQYGFRKGKSTAHAIHIIRRLMDIGSRAGQQFSMVLLDWEKAFD